MAKRLIGIRKEDKSVWETRAPLIPEDVAELKQMGIATTVQSWNRRVFKDEEYLKAGASVLEHLDVPFIFGIKEIPLEIFEEGKTYIFFSHTIKGQAYNMPMLKRILSLKDTLIDYERITDENGRRLIAFGKFAGLAGMIDTLWALGQRWEWEGFKAPLSRIKKAWQYRDFAEFREQALSISEEIIEEGLPEGLKPFIIGISGYGNVSQGAQETLACLPVKEIKPSEVFQIENGENAIYKVVFKEEDMVARRDGAAFDLEDYYRHPQDYRAIFEKYLSHLTVLVNCIYWDARYPRLLTKDWLRENYPQKLKVIGDLSCDIHGAVEINVKTTASDDPVYCYRPGTGEITMGYKGEGPVVLAVDILPSELPREASVYFSGRLKPFVQEIIAAKYPQNFADCTLPGHLKRAVIVYQGRLAPDYEYLREYF